MTGYLPKDQVGRYCIAWLTWPLWSIPALFVTTTVSNGWGVFTLVVTLLALIGWAGEGKKSV